MLIGFLKNFDWYLLVALILLTAISLVTLWSLSDGDFSFFRKQAIWVAVGFSVFLAIAYFDYRIFRNHGGVILIFYFFSILALFFLYLAGVKTRGVTGWFHLENFTLQPSEFLKIVLIILLAKFFSKRHVDIYQAKLLLVSFIYAALPAFLILIQPDFGSAVVIMFLWVAMTIFSGIKTKHFLILMAVFLTLAAASWFFLLRPYQKERIVSFVNPQADPRGVGYNSIQSLIAIGSGGIWGRGIGQGLQSHLHFLPEAENDFIFAAFAEEWGLIGNFVLLSAYAVLLLRILKIGREAENNFAKLYCLGLSALIFFQLFIHIGMNLGILPITGLTLPFVSYGGSSLITLMAGLGVVESIHIYSRKEV